ncbi:hypothetical protein Tco_0613374, partial [Tanacetum coccineum]
MEEVKGLKKQIKTRSCTFPSDSQASRFKSSKQKTWFGPCKYCGLRNHPTDDCYSKPKCFTCGSNDHLTKDHIEQAAVKKTLIKLKAQSPLYPTPKKTPMIPKPFTHEIADSLKNQRNSRNQGLLTNDPLNPLKRSIIVKRHGKIAYEVFRGRAPDISYFHVFGCPVHIHNHRDHLGKFDEKANDGFFLCYSPLAKAFKTSTEGDTINFDEVNFFPDDEFLEPKCTDTQYSANTKYFPYVQAFDRLSTINSTNLENITSSDSAIPQDSESLEEPQKDKNKRVYRGGLADIGLGLRKKLSLKYPPDFEKKTGSNDNNQNRQNFNRRFVNNNSVGSSSSSSSSFSDKQITKLISLIKENSENNVGKGVHANMAGELIVDSGANQHLTYNDTFLVNVIDSSKFKIKSNVLVL